ncbi:DnaA regulatory inactivator Hda [Exilibacterium tricleocarpae]|uniref:DnaA regulatory inactivator Hda n=1 Tax=Exilibacterium tricleocarpae TaxID=2591008 RepID=A0A545UBI3_9GAMM|nr:DnaA regulatory inactivator Hda [Exilibacterium tricleocarpae]
MSLNDDATFDNFYTRPNTGNAQVVKTLRGQAQGEGGETYVYLWGGAGVGLTHLLQAACHACHFRGLTAQYLPLREMVGFTPQALLEGLESVDLLCLDGLQAVAGQAQWERALFHLFNRLHDQRNCLLAAAHCSLAELPVELADLASRLRSGVAFQVTGMSDDDKQAALQARAAARGLDLSDEVAQYILHRAPRDTNELFYCLNRLDDASLAEQRRLTIPFVKRVLNL